MIVLPILGDAAVQTFTVSIADMARCRGAGANPDDVVVCGARERAGGATLPIEVNGQAGLMLIDPGGPKVASCNPDFALRARFQGRGPIVLNHVGPVEIKGGYGSIAYKLDGRLVVRPTNWSAQRAVVGADCWMGPEGLSANVVRFVLRPPGAGDRTERLKIYAEPMGEHDGSTDALWVVGKTNVAVRFDLQRDRTALTAPATIATVRAYGGRLEGPVEQTEIWYDIQRPVRRLRLAHPIVVGPLTVAEPFARVGDYGDARGVQADDPNEQMSGDDVLVQGKAPRLRGQKILRIGRDDLIRCASITFDKPRHEIELSCSQHTYPGVPVATGTGAR